MKPNPTHSIKNAIATVREPFTQDDICRLVKTSTPESIGVTFWRFVRFGWIEYAGERRHKHKTLYRRTKSFGQPVKPIEEQPVCLSIYEQAWRQFRAEMNIPEPI